MTTIKLKNGSGAPLAGNLVQGEPALDLTNKRLYTENSSGAVIEVGTNPTSLTTGGLTVDGLTQLNTNNLSNGLTISGNDNANVKVRFDNTGTSGGDFVIQGGIAGASNQGLSIRDLDNSAQRIHINSGGDISFYEDTGTTAKFFWDSSAESLGIGTSSPTAKLSLQTATGTNNTSYNIIDATTDNPTYKAQINLVREDSSGKLGWAFLTNNVGSPTERMRIDSSGQVKVGTTGPTWDSTFGSFVTKGGFLSSQSTSYNYVGGQAYYDGAFKRLNANAAELYEQSFGNHIFYNAISGAAGSTITWNERMRIDASGNLLVGTTDDVVQTNSGTGNGGIVLRNNNYVAVASDGSAALELNRLASDGTIANFRKDGTSVGSIGASTGTAYIQGNASSSGFLFGNSNIYPWDAGAINDAGIDLGGSSNRFKDIYLQGIAYIENQIVSVGTYTQTTATAANVNIRSDGLMRRSTSSIRYKNTVLDATHGLTELLALRPVTYKGNDDGDAVFGGLIAEEVHDAGLTEFVQYNEDNQPDALAYGNMVSLCIKAIQEQQATITALEARITELETP